MRRAGLRFAVVACLWSALLAEVLGSFCALTPLGSWLGWIVFIAFASAGPYAMRGSPRLKFGHPEGEQRWALAGCALVAAVALFSALMAPVVNWDSMTYHLPRVRHWLANRDVALYPSHVLRQVCYTPGAEYLLAHLRLLTGSALFDSLPQWGALLGLMAAASLIAERLAGRVAGAFAALLVAGMPIAVVEATTAQNDLLGAFWAACAFAFALEDEPLRAENAYWLWAAVAVANLTKPTAVLFAGPALLIAVLRSSRPARALALATALGAAAFLPLLPLYARNYKAFGSPVGVATNPTNERHGLSTVVSNGLRYAALQVPFVPAWNAVARLHLALRLDPNDRATSMNAFWRPDLARRLDRLASADEDFAGSPVQSAFALVALIGVLAGLARGRRPSRDAALAAGALALGWLVFLFLVKWQEWGNRLTMPGIALTIPLSAAWAAKRLSSSSLKAIGGLLVATGVLCTLRESHRPLIPLQGPAGIATPSILSGARGDAYLRSGYGREHADAFARLPAQLARDGCKSVGLVLGEDDWEEPWWALSGARFKHVNVDNESAGLPQEFPDSELCAVIEAKGAAVLYYDRNDLKTVAMKDGKISLPVVAEPEPGAFSRGVRKHSLERKGVLNR